MAGKPAADDLFGHYTDRARAALAAAQEHARRSGSASVEPEHLLLGLTGPGGDVASMVLAAVGVSPEAVHRETVSHVSVGSVDRRGSLALSVSTQDVLAQAEREADILGHPHVGSEHLLLALAGQPAGVAGQVLATLGLDDGLLRAATQRLLTGLGHGVRSKEEPTLDRVLGGRRFALPTGLEEINEEIAEARWQKEVAIDAQEFEVAAAWRDEEKGHLARKRGLARAWVTDAGDLALVDEIERLYRQADRLRDLLDRHGLDPYEGDPAPPARDGARTRRPVASIHPGESGSAGSAGPTGSPMPGVGRRGAGAHEDELVEADEP